MMEGRGEDLGDAEDGEAEKWEGGKRRKVEKWEIGGGRFFEETGT